MQGCFGVVVLVFVNLAAQPTVSNTLCFGKIMTARASEDATWEIKRGPVNCLSVVFPQLDTRGRSRAS